MGRECKPFNHVGSSIWITYEIKHVCDGLLERLFHLATKSFKIIEFLTKSVSAQGIGSGGIGHFAL